MTPEEATAWIAKWYPTVAREQVRDGFVEWRLKGTGPLRRIPVVKFAQRLQKQRTRRGKPI